MENHLRAEEIRHQAWAGRYRDRHTAGLPGWGYESMYEAKKAQLNRAFARHPVGVGAAYLELGCGAGNITLWAAEQGLVCTGVDIVPEAIAWAQEKSQSAHTPAAFLVGDVGDMSFASSCSYDVVYEGDCLHMIIGEGRAEAFSEVCRVLKPTGVFVCGASVVFDTLEKSRYDHDGVPAYFDVGEQTLFIAGRREYHHSTEMAFIKELTESGFDIAAVERYPARSGQGSEQYLKAWIEVEAVPLPDHRKILGRA